MVSLDHINMTVRNLQESLDWYAKVFGFEVVEQGQHSGEPFAIVRTGESMLCLYQSPGLEAPDSDDLYRVYHFGLRVDNQEEWEQHLAKIKVQPSLVWDYPFSKSWYLTDPTGHEIEVCYWQNNRIQFKALA